MNVAIITIGDELLIGQVINRNAVWIAEQCTNIGCSVIAHSVVGDQAEDLTSEIRRLGARCSALILTGGLGPTHDDITKFVLAEMAGDHMVVHQPWVDHLRAWLARRGRELTARNAGQAEVPSTAAVLHNPVGTAPGLWMTIEGTIVVALPGVPREMQALMTAEVLPRFASHVALEEGPIWTYHTLQTTGIAESNLADLIGEPSEFLGASTLAFLPNLQGVRLRIGVVGRSDAERTAERDRVRAILWNRAGRFIFGEGDRTLSEAVGLELAKRGHTIAVAESCTGGLLGAELTKVQGSSAWFLGGYLAYDNRVKISEVCVHPADLDRVGAVSQEVAEQLATGARVQIGTTWGIGITGIAGPGGGTAEKPVGTIWIALAGPGGVKATRFQFGDERHSNRERSVGAALGMLWTALKADS
ncbi:MAG: competence/damage-inducible protein A [Candidatus Kapaibacteriota bacterium]